MQNEALSRFIVIYIYICTNQTGTGKAIKVLHVEVLPPTKSVGTFRGPTRAYCSDSDTRCWEPQGLFGTKVSRISRNSRAVEAHKRGGSHKLKGHPAMFTVSYTRTRHGQ